MEEPKSGKIPSNQYHFAKPKFLEVHVQADTEIENNFAVAASIRKPIHSPLGDESVRGYATDKRPKHNGVSQMVDVVELLERNNIICCMVAEPALVYYGAKRIVFDWPVCVPHELMSQAVSLLESRKDIFEPFRPSAIKDFLSLNHLYPRFKLVGHAVFFVLVSSQACHLSLRPENVEYDRWIHIPYPSLSSYAQSLLDTWNLTDLEDLVDGMNLSIEWGEQNLDLAGLVDVAWAQWRDSRLAGQHVQREEDSACSGERRAIWHRATSTQAKLDRQGWKGKKGRETRFWKSGQQDPRDAPKNYH